MRNSAAAAEKQQAEDLVDMLAAMGDRAPKTKGSRFTQIEKLQFAQVLVSSNVQYSLYFHHSCFSRVHLV